jgi:transcription initiation factor TFIID TATA-box-binding protein
VQVNNIISHTSLGCAVDICQAAVGLAGRAGTAVFPASVSHCHTTKTTQSVFKSGELVIVGAKLEESALLSAYLYATALQRELRLRANVFNFETNNIVGHFELPYRLNVDLFLNDHELEARWEPETFKGLSYIPQGEQDGAVSFVLFETGKCIITGGKSVEDLQRAYDSHEAKFLKYKVGAEYRQQTESRKKLRPWFSSTTKDKSRDSPKAQQSNKKKKQKRLTQTTSTSESVFL